MSSKENDIFEDDHNLINGPEYKRPTRRDSGEGSPLLVGANVGFDICRMWCAQHLLELSIILSGVFGVTSLGVGIGEQHNLSKASYGCLLGIGAALLLTSVLLITYYCIKKSNLSGRNENNQEGSSFLQNCPGYGAI